MLKRIRTYARRCIGYIISGQPKIEIKADISYLSPNNLLKGKNILITGGGRGLGYAMAKKFTDEGAKVVIVGRNADQLEKAANEIGCSWIQFDVTDFENHGKLISIANQKLGGHLNTLINNAGISLHEGEHSNVTLEQFDKQISCNLKGGYFLSQSFIKLTSNQPERNILFVSSERGFQSDDLPYGLTKAAVNSFVRGLAFRYVKKGIRVNAIAPGVTSSDMTNVAMDGNLYYPSNSNDRAYLPEEVAEVATFLVSDASKCVSGQIICCNEAKTVNAHWK